jgi:hypothetical protein
MPYFSPQHNSFSENAILSFTKFVFDYRSGQMGTANHKNMDFFKKIGRTNEAAGLIALSPNSAQNLAIF